MKEIVQKDNPILRKKAEEVPLTDIPSPKIQSIIKDMIAALDGEEDGVAIAAPQIAVPLRIFVVSGKVFDDDMNMESALPKEKTKADLICINPEITKQSRKGAWLNEGCLSVRPLYGRVKRADKVTLTYYDERGTAHTRGASGLLAQIFQHETDHLDGILFVDKARDIEEIPLEKSED